MLTGRGSGRRSHVALTALRQDVAVGGVLTSTVPPANFVTGITNQITFIALDASGSPIVAGPISTVYTSSNTGIVTVSGTGLVTAIGVGTATVTIQADGWRNVLTYTASSGAAVRQDWSTFANDAALKAANIIGVYAAANQFTSPVTPGTDYYELISDPLFGKVVRYKGGPWANTVNDPSGNALGAVATHTVNFGPLTKVWVRQIGRFAPNWTPSGATPISFNDSYKYMFILWEGEGFRQAFGFLNSVMWNSEFGQGPGTPYPNTGALLTPPTTPGDCSAPFRYAPPMIRTSLAKCTFANIADTPGNGEWYEFVMGYEMLTLRVARATMARRQYTVAGVVNPQAWEVFFSVEQTRNAGYPDWVRARTYQMGVNRNKSFDEDMTWDWGPYEIIDGTQYPNPFNFPGL